MSRNRMIKPEFCKSKTLSSISLESNLFFILLWTHCDDFGTIINSNRFILGSCYPVRETVTEKHIEKWKQELISKELLIPISYEDQDLLIVRSWEDHQTVNNRSKRNNLNNNLANNEIIKQIETLVNDYLVSNESLSRVRVSKEKEERGKKKGKEKEKDELEIIPLPSEQELKQIFFTELVKKCKKRNISYRDLNYNRAMDQFDVYVDYCKKYHGTAKSYSDYPGASRTFMRELDKLVLKSYEENSKELPDFTICGGVYKAIEEDEDMNRYMCVKCGNKEMYKPEKCLRDVK